MRHLIPRAYLPTQLDFCLRRPRKRLRKADPDQQLAFAAQLPTLELERRSHSVSVWLDEGHIRKDALLRWVRYLRGQKAEADSSAPGKPKLSFYVAAVRPLG